MYVCMCVCVCVCVCVCTGRQSGREGSGVTAGETKLETENRRRVAGEFNNSRATDETAYGDTDAVHAYVRAG